MQGNSGGSDGYLATRTSTATKTDTPLRDVPQSVSVVTKEQIKDIGAQKLEDVVRYVPGVVWHQGENNRDQVVIRGQSSTADFFDNGIRDDAQYFRDLYNAERVEFLKGPNAMIFGRAGYAYTDARIIGATSATIVEGNRVALVPYNQFSLWNRYDINENWGAGVGVICMSDFFASSDDTVILPAYTRVDGAIFYKLNKNLGAQLNVENIFGVAYYPTADGNNNITPGSPRAARLSITASY